MPRRANKVSFITATKPRATWNAWNRYSSCLESQRGKTCEAIQGIIAEADEIIEEFKGTPALDAGLISSAQAVEHYEIARYGTLIEWAKQLGLKDAVTLLQQTLEEEKATDQKLTKLAETAANAKARKAA